MTVRTVSAWALLFAAAIVGGCDRSSPPVEPVTGTGAGKPAGKLPAPDAQRADGTVVAEPAAAANATPVAAIRSFYTALVDEDADGAKAVTLSPEPHAEWIEAQVLLHKGFKDLGRAGVARFGEEGKVLQLPLPAAGILQKLDSIQPTESGDRAQWPVNPAAPLQLRKTAHGWKIDLTASFGSGELSAQHAALFIGTADYLDDIAQGIQNGDYASVDQVRQEMKRRREALNAGQ